jgi:hypothetical protein
VRGVGETGRTNSGCGGDDGRVRWWRRQVALVLRFAQDVTRDDKLTQYDKLNWIDAFEEEVCFRYAVPWGGFFIWRWRG